MNWNGEEQGYEVTTPNGLVIQYEPRPRRLYRIGRFEQAFVEVPSVTEILRCLDKPALPWWGMDVGISGVLTLHAEHGITVEQLLAGKPVDMPMFEWARLISRGPAFKEHELRTNDVRDEASTRGQTVHNAFSYWASTGLLPYPGEYPEWEQGYVLALIAFLRDVPSLEPEGIELAVASEEHGFAGRYDLRAKTSEPHRVVVKRYEKWKPATGVIPPSRILWDLKSSSDIYAEHGLQLGAYEMASIESGYEPTDWRAVVQLSAEGYYQCRWTKSTGEDFLAVKAAWEALKRAQAGLKVKRPTKKEREARDRAAAN